jgi:RNA polymerase sigma factor (sigma-70 family)
VKQNRRYEERITRFAEAFMEIAPALSIALRRRYSISLEEADDTLDEIQVKLFEEIKESVQLTLFERLDERNFKNYIATAVVNQYLNKLKHRSVIERSEQELLFVLEKASTPESEASRAELVKRLYTAVCKLPEPYKEIFKTLLNEDVTLAELARRRNIKLGTIYTKFQRGLKLLREIWVS